MPTSQSINPSMSEKCNIYRWQMPRAPAYPKDYSNYKIICFSFSFSGIVCVRFRRMIRIYGESCLKLMLEQIHWSRIDSSHGKLWAWFNILLVRSGRKKRNDVVSTTFGRPIEPSIWWDCANGISSKSHEIHKIQHTLSHFEKKRRKKQWNSIWIVVFACAAAGHTISNQIDQIKWFLLMNKWGFICQMSERKKEEKQKA